MSRATARNVHHAGAEPQTPLPSSHCASRLGCCGWFDLTARAACRPGNALAEGAHVCVNGAGNTGCMGALNDACVQSGGKVVRTRAPPPWVRLDQRPRVWAARCCAGPRPHARGHHSIWHATGSSWLGSASPGLREGLPRHTDPHVCRARQVGVIHEMWVKEDKDELHRGIEVQVVGGDSLAERKRGLSEGCDCFISMPGGVGTMGELFEAISERSLNFHNCPVVLMNVDGFFDTLVRRGSRATRIHEERLLALGAHS